MAFSSVQFLFIFLPLSLAVYWLLPKALRNGALGAFSLLFFAWAGLKGAAILLALAAITWLGGLLLEKLPRRFCLCLSRGGTGRKIPHRDPSGGWYCLCYHRYR